MSGNHTAYFNDQVPGFHFTIFSFIFSFWYAIDGNAGIYGR